MYVRLVPPTDSVRLVFPFASVEVAQVEPPSVPAAAMRPPELACVPATPGAPPFIAPPLPLIAPPPPEPASAAFDPDTLSPPPGCPPSARPPAPETPPAPAPALP